MRYELPIADREILLRYQRNISGKGYIKVTSLLMLSNGLSIATVSDSLGIAISTVYRYRNSYKELGLDSFPENRLKAIGVCFPANK